MPQAIARPLAATLGHLCVRGQRQRRAAAWASSAMAGASLAAAGLLALPASAVTLGLTDSFSGGVTAGWTSGGGSPNPPTGVASGGPAGAGDGYLRISSSGVPGPGGRLIAFSSAPWAGDYITAGITGITMDLKNLGASDLSLRLYFENALTSAYSLLAIPLPAGGGWTPVHFDIRVPALSAAAAATLASTTDFRIYSSALAVAPQGSPFVAASLGIDNVSAVPEPGAGLLMALGLAGLLAAPALRRR